MFELDGSRVLVTGGLGFIGRRVLEALAAQGAEPVAVSHPSAEVEESRGVIAADLAEPAALDGRLDGVDAVVHLAARAGGIVFQERDRTGTFAANRAMTDNVLAAARSAGVERVFLASTAAIYRSADGALSEDSPKLTIDDDPSEYAWSKITDEVVSSWYSDFDTVVGRFGNVYGPGAPLGRPGTTVVHALIDRALGLESGEDLLVWGDGSAIRSFVFVEDVARAVVAILERAEPGSAVNVDSGSPVTIAELARWIRDEAAPSAGIEFDPTKPTGPSSRYGDVSRLHDLGCSARVDLQTGIGITVAAMRQDRE